MHDQVKLLDQAAQLQHQGFDSLVGVLQNQQNLLASTPAIWPVKGWVTSTFGRRKSPFTGLREFHKGLDIATRKGTPIIAPADGVVSAVGTKGFLGKMIAVDHGHGIVTRFGHLQKALKKRGDKVKRGDVIALVGATGRVTGPHVHYEVRLNGLPVNPKKYILN
ncbi:MAG: M23 family metallopeptidase [Desulfobacterales bacterium]|nr:M23 family metallopeptidase [Desulfobacterales bacterium]